MASYPGGQEQLGIFLKDHVEYPELARDNNFEGTTIIRFKVLANGQLDQYTVQQSTHEICDQEVIKALKEMAPWTSAKLLGKEVASWRAVAVDFKMKF
jgi:protein TonB